MKARFSYIVTATIIAAATFLITLITVQSTAAKSATAASQRQSVDPTQEGPGQSPLLEKTPGWPYGAAEAVAADESRELVFLGSGGTVLVFDVGDPVSPTLLSDQIVTLGYVMDVFYEPADQLLYVAAGEGGLEIWDLANPSVPQQRSITELYYGGVDIPVEGITVVDDFAYVAADWGFLHWVDVTDPSAPFQVGFNGAYLRPNSVYANDGYLYAMGIDTGTFVTADFARFIIEPDGSLSFAGGRELGICVSAVTAWPNAYVGCGEVHIIDLSDPLLPTIGTINYSSSGTIISGSHAYLASQGDGLVVVDVSNPAGPIQVGSYDSPGFANDVVRLGQYAYMADDHGGLRVIDISDPVNPTSVASHDTPGWARYADVEGNHAFLAEYSEGVLILDVSEPLTPTLVGQYPTTDGTYDVDVQGNVAYVADLDGGLRLVDVTEPSSPVELGHLSGIKAFRVAAQGNYAYVADAVITQPYRYWLRVIDTSNPAQPVEVGALQTGGFIYRVIIREDYAYLANDDVGLTIIDISDPANPMEVGNYAVPSVWEIAIQGDYAYLAAADWAGGFLVIDVSNPANPTLVAEYNPTGWFHPYHVAVLGNFAYVSRQSELHLFDISNPAAPQQLETVDLPLNVNGLTARGEYVLVADENAGLQIYRNTLPNEIVQLGPESHEASLPGSTVTHTFHLENLGASGQFSLTLSESSWQSILLNSSPITVESGSSAAIFVTVELPHLSPNDPDRSDGFTLTAARTSDPSQTAATTGQTEAVVQAQPQISLNPTRLSAEAGNTVSLTVAITNQGQYSDILSLSASGPLTVTLPFTETSLLLAGEMMSGLLWIDIPEDTDDQQVIITVTTASAWNPDETDTAEVMITVGLPDRVYAPLIIGQ